MKVFISAERKELESRQNLLRTIELESILMETYKDRYSQASGVYQGDHETSFIIETNNYLPLLELAEQLDRECILVVNDQDRATLVYPNGDKQDIGFMVRANALPMGTQDYTYSFAETCYYYVVESLPNNNN